MGVFICCTVFTPQLWKPKVCEFGVNTRLSFDFDAASSLVKPKWHLSLVHRI